MASDCVDSLGNSFHCCRFLRFVLKRLDFVSFFLLEKFVLRLWTFVGFFLFFLCDFFFSESWIFVFLIWYSIYQSVGVSFSCMDGLFLLLGRICSLLRFMDVFFLQKISPLDAGCCVLCGIWLRFLFSWYDILFTIPLVIVPCAWTDYFFFWEELVSFAFYECIFSAKILPFDAGCCLLCGIWLRLFEEIHLKEDHETESKALKGEWSCEKDTNMSS